MIGVDLAKDVLQVVVADAASRVRESHRLTRTQFERFFMNRVVSLVVMEACGSAHHRARRLNRLGIEQDIKPVRVKSVEQQALQALHRTRSLWKADRTRRINTLRGF